MGTQPTTFGYEFLRGGPQYSDGVRATADYEIVRVTLNGTPGLPEGYDRIERHLLELNIPLTALCAVEMRSPSQFNESEFESFNSQYRERLSQWGLLAGGENPVARANVIPKYNKPSQPAIHAFSYVRFRPGCDATFVVSGSVEVQDSRGDNGEYIVASGDVSAEGLWRKADFVLNDLARRLQSLGSSWSEVSNTQLYTIHNAFSVLAELDKRTSLGAEVSWHLCGPPMEGLDFEMDCRKTFTEYRI